EPEDPSPGPRIRCGHARACTHGNDVGDLHWLVGPAARPVLAGRGRVLRVPLARLGSVPGWALLPYPAARAVAARRRPVGLRAVPAGTACRVARAALAQPGRRRGRCPV